MPQQPGPFYEPALWPYHYNSPTVHAQDKPYTSPLPPPSPVIKHTKRQRSRCCCPCLPLWARRTCCCVFVFLTIFMIAIGILVALFKMPIVEFNGVADHPEGLERLGKSSSNSMGFDINVGLNIGVVNPNIESATFDTIRAIAYYPTAPLQPVGGGKLDHIVIGSQRTTNFTFPFQISYNPQRDSDQRMIMDISKRCGLTGAPRQDLTINYALTPTMSILGLPFSITIHNSARFPCPLSEKFMINATTSTFLE